MTKQEYKEWNQKAAAGEISDDQNPALVFNSIPNDLLAQIVAGEFDLRQLAKHILAERGCDAAGKWVGFGKK